MRRITDPKLRDADCKSASAADRKGDAISNRIFKIYSQGFTSIEALTCFQIIGFPIAFLLVKRKLKLPHPFADSFNLNYFIFKVNAVL